MYCMISIQHPSPHVETRMTWDDTHPLVRPERAGCRTPHSSCRQIYSPLAIPPPPLPLAAGCGPGAVSAGSVADGDGRESACVADGERRCENGRERVDGGEELQESGCAHIAVFFSFVRCFFFDWIGFLSSLVCHFSTHIFYLLCGTGPRFHRLEKRECNRSR